MQTDSCEKKRRGRWGESMVDTFMATVGYEVALANKNFPGGEIDRIYVRNGNSAAGHSLCVSEVKTSSVHSAEELGVYGEFAVFSRFVKPRQMRNLRRFGESFAAKSFPCSSRVNLFARLFLVVRIVAGDGLRPQNVEGFPGKVCVRKAGYWIFSVDPEVTADRFMC